MPSAATHPREASASPSTFALNRGQSALLKTEARDLAPLYLANAFSRRDIARVNIHQVASWLFEATQEAPGRLTYLPVPQPSPSHFAATSAASGTTQFTR